MSDSLRELHDFHLVILTKVLKQKLELIELGESLALFILILDLKAHDFQFVDFLLLARLVLRFLSISPLLGLSELISK